MALRLSSGDVTAFKLLISLAILYGLMSFVVYSVVHMKFIKPLSFDAPPDRFSEARAIHHIRVLSEDIHARQVVVLSITNKLIPSLFIYTHTFFKLL